MNQWRPGTQPYIWVIIIAKMQRADLLFGRLIVDAWCKEYMESPFKPMMTKFPAPYMSHQVKLNSKSRPSVWSNNCQYILQRTHQGLQNWPTVHQTSTLTTSPHIWRLKQIDLSKHSIILDTRVPLFSSSSAAQFIANLDSPSPTHAAGLVSGHSSS